jgi:FkbM family methyltransferase
MIESNVALDSPASIWNRRKHCTLRTWLVSLYDRLLISRLGNFLPFRGRVVTAHLHAYPDPFFVRLGSSDWLVLDEICIREGYREVFDRVGSPKSIVDLGSNIGCSIRLWASQFPEARVVGVEPDSGNLEICKRNLVAFARNCRVINAFAGSEQGFAEVNRDREAWEFRVGEYVNEPTSQSVPVMTMQCLLEQANSSAKVDLVKCDIEGGEVDLFRSNTEWLKHVKCLIVELHGDYRPNQLEKDLEKSGTRFRLEVIDQGESWAIVFLTNSSS